MLKIKISIILLFTVLLTVVGNRALGANITVVGAGPAGILVTGMLLDAGARKEDIHWIDPEFNVGRMGKYYTTVPGNNKTSIFIDFINSCQAFQHCNPSSIDRINSYGPEQDYPLDIIVEPLQTITNYLCTQVNAHKSTLISLEFADNNWDVITTDSRFTSHIVILATGAHPKTLEYNCPNNIPLDTALDKKSLAALVNKNDSIAVVGSSHSAVIILMYLSQLPVKRIINFYKNQLCYTYEADGVTHNWTNGLKGTAARWAKNVLEKNPPQNLIRVFNTSETLRRWLPLCNKIIYAIGYERNELPPIHCFSDNIYNSYDCSTGTIAPRLFGIGIAFPEHFIDEAGEPQLGIGLRDFLNYVRKVLPSWLQTKEEIFYKKMSCFEELFYITQL